MERLAERPAASIPEACDSWSETVAAYCFLRNPDVAWEGILAPRRSGADSIKSRLLLRHCARYGENRTDDLCIKL
jgi:hypothetical protein